MTLHVVEHERPTILAEAHDGIAGGHYAGKAIVQKVLCRVMVAYTPQGCKGILSDMRCLSKGWKTLQKG
jgi:hypothetical protein